MSAVEYSYVQLKKECRAVDPTKGDRVVDKRQYEAFSDAVNQRGQVLRLSREGEALRVMHLESGRSIEIPWGSVAFARPMPGKAEPGEPPKGLSSAAAVGKFKP